MDEPDLLDSDQDASAQFLVASRFWIQKVLVPLTVLIGVCGNIITVMVLTRFSIFVRRRMRCTTTIYLTALALADIIYLLFVFLLSLEKYDRFHEQRFELYWRFFGISHWICDAASSTSVWLTVSFTIERYIVVCHPIKGKVHCTESRAKNIITIVTILCLVSTASTTFEYQLKVDEKCIITKQTNDSIGNVTLTIPLDIEHSIVDNPDNVSSTIEYDTNRVRRNTVEFDEQFINVSDQNKSTDDCLNQTSDCCNVTYMIGTEPTALANNAVYTTAFYWFSSIGFGLLPLVLIATFNSFLVHAVYRSQKQRRRLTNAADNSSQNNENRITLLLISVVILFLICQTPTAVYLIYAAFQRAESTFVMNIEKGLGNIFNFLLTLNAACNFILYCVLSAKFRRTFRLVFCHRKGGGVGVGAGNVATFGASIIRNNRRHFGGNTECNSFGTSAFIDSSTNNYGRGTVDTEIATTMVTSQGQSTRYSQVTEQLSEEDDDNSDIDVCTNDLVDGRKTATATATATANGQIISGIKQQTLNTRNGNASQEQEPISKTPRNIETLSFNSMPRTGSMLMRPIGKARSTDLVV